MADFDQIQQLILELGPTTDEIDEVQEEGSAAWTIFFADSSVGIDYVEEQDKLVLSSSVGRLPEGDREKSYQFLLFYNNAWDQTGGVKMALESEDGDVLMMLDLNASLMDLNTLRDILIRFAEKSVAWRTAVTSGLQGGAADNMPQVDPFAGAIRV